MEREPLHTLFRGYGLALIVGAALAWVGAAPAMVFLVVWIGGAAACLLLTGVALRAAARQPRANAASGPDEDAETTRALAQWEADRRSESANDLSLPESARAGSAL